MGGPDPMGGIRQSGRLTRCPRCGAEPGEPCQGKNGPREQNHQERWEAAREDPASRAAKREAKTDALIELWEEATGEVLSPRHRAIFAGRPETTKLRTAPMNAVRGAAFRVVETTGELRLADWLDETGWITDG